MEAVKHQHQRYQILSKFGYYPNNLKLATKLLPSLLLLSLILLCSSLLPLLLNLKQFVSSNVSKNYMFLVCNGILVLIVKNSGLIAINSQEQNLPRSENATVLKAAHFTKTKAIIAQKTVQEVAELTEEKSLPIVQDTENVPLIAQEVEAEERTDQIIIVEDQEEEEEVGMLLSTEELNKKCEDFIRKMKQDIRFEHRQLIPVH